MYHRQSIELWLYNELFTINPQMILISEDFLHLLASATLVDFPQFRDIHHLIPQVLDMTHTAKLQVDYHEIEDSDSDKWEIYVKYRQIVSRFLIDQTCCRNPPYSSKCIFLYGYHWSRSQENYVNLAKYLLRFLWESSW